MTLSIFTFVIEMGFSGRSPGLLVAVRPIFSTTSIPSTTSPKMLCLLSSHGVAASVMKNWLPLVFGPALAIESRPGLVVAQLRAELVGEFVAGAAGSRAQRIAPLNHEAFDDAMKDEPVIKRTLRLLSGLRIGELFRPFGQPREVRHRVRDVGIEQPNLEIAFSRRKECMQHPNIIAIMETGTP